MKRFLTLSVMMLGLVGAWAQSAQDTAQWIHDSIAEKGGDSISMRFYQEEMLLSRQPDTYNGVPGYDETMSYSDIRSVSRSGNSIDVFGVITVSTNHCSNCDKKSLRHAYLQINNMTDSDYPRVIKALTHLAQINGAVFKKNDLF